MTFFEKVSNKISIEISETLKLDKNKTAIIAYGTYAVLDIVSSLAMVMIFGALFGVCFEALLFSFSSSLLRKTSGGAHATTSARCIFIGTMFSVGFAILIKSIAHFITGPLSITYIFISFIISFFIIRRLAPKDSPNKRIVKQEKIKELKYKSIRTLCVYTVICLVIFLFSIYKQNTNLLPYTVIICTGHLWQSLTLTSFGYNLTRVLELPFRYKKKQGGENK